MWAFLLHPLGGKTELHRASVLSGALATTVLNGNIDALSNNVHSLAASHLKLNKANIPEGLVLPQLSPSLSTSALHIILGGRHACCTAVLHARWPLSELPTAPFQTSLSAAIQWKEELYLES